MTRAPQRRRFRGQHLDAAKLLDMFTDDSGMSWAVYIVGRGPKGLLNLKLAAYGHVIGKANYWLTWAGKITRRNEGSVLWDRNANLASKAQDVISAALAESATTHTVRSLNSISGTCGGATTHTIGTSVVVAPATRGSLDDGSDLI